MKNASPAITAPPAPRCIKVANAISMSDVLVAFTTKSSQPRAWAAVSALATSASAALCQRRTLLIYSITPSARPSTCERNRKSKRFCGLEIDEQFHLSRQHDRQVARLFALEDAPDVDSCLPMRFCKATAVAHQSTCCSEFA